MGELAVVVQLLGGLGNQMFQYAAGRALADRWGCSLKLDLTHFDQDPQRTYNLDGLNIRAEIATTDELRSVNRLSYNSVISKLLSLYPRKGRNVKRYRLFKERKFVFDETLIDQRPPVYLAGYWQSERYFSDFAAAIRRDFSINFNLDSEARRHLESIKNTSSISLHVRRGDYVTNPIAARYHGVCSLDYYLTAANYIAAQVSEPHFFVFSDDIKWVTDNLRLPYVTTFVNFDNKKHCPIVDMQLMKVCKHHVIANSSFSWWGAWLNPSQHKVVVAPKKWFNHASADTKDLLPYSWVCL